MTTGKVKWFNPSRGYGFIETEDKGADVFVHISAVEQSGLSTLNEGQSIDFEIQDKDGKQSAYKITEAA